MPTRLSAPAGPDAEPDTEPDSEPAAVAGTNLHVVDTPGADPALVFLDGCGRPGQWRPVLGSLAGRYRTVQFRARGRSGAGDLSVAAAVDDLGRVVRATRVERPVLVGWSAGATVAVRYAADHPGEVAGLVLVDGAWPVSVLAGHGRQDVRDRVSRPSLAARAAAAVGLAARLTPEQLADLVIDVDAVNGRLAADFAALTCPATFVLGTGGHASVNEPELRRARQAAREAAGHTRVSVFATAPNGPRRILSRSPDLVVGAIDDVVSQAW